MKLRSLALVATLLALSAPAALGQNTIDQGTQLTAFFNGTQSITKAFPKVAGKSLYITQITASGTATGVLTITKGTSVSTACDTSAVVLYTQAVIAGTPLNHGDGTGAIAVVGSGVDLCLTVSTASLSGWVSVAQF